MVEQLVVCSHLRLLSGAARLDIVLVACFAHLKDVMGLVDDQLLAVSSAHHSRVLVQLVRISVPDHLGRQRPAQTLLPRIGHASRHNGFHRVDCVVARRHLSVLIPVAHTLLRLLIDAASIRVPRAACQLRDGLLLQQAGLNLGELGLVVQVEELLDRLHHLDVVIQPGWSHHSCCIFRQGLTVSQPLQLVEQSVAIVLLHSNALELGVDPWNSLGCWITSDRWRLLQSLVQGILLVR